MSANNWEKFFDKHAADYHKESFVQNTISEVDFVARELNLPAGATILDIGCGSGRHALELARRGYKVTGIDISNNMLEIGRKKAKEENLDAIFVQADATEYIAEKEYDACICLCEGAFGLLSQEEDPFEHSLSILGNIGRSIKTGAKFILTCSNGLRMIRIFNLKEIESGRFDPLYLVEKYPLTELIPDAESDVHLREKGFVPSELMLMFHNSGFQIEKIGNGTAGSWDIDRIDPNDMELMVLAIKVSS